MKLLLTTSFFAEVNFSIHTLTWLRILTQM